MNLMPRIALLLALTAAVTVSAQPPPDDAPPFRHHQENGPLSIRPASPLQQWMKQLAESEPEEFERLQNLRMQDPQEFRRVTREKLLEHGLKKLNAERPAVHEALMNLPEEDRQWVADRLLRPNIGPPPGRDERDNKGPRREGGPPGIDRTLIRAYKQAETDEEKSAARDRIRENLAALYDRQLAERREQLTEAEEKLAAIRNAIERGEAGKDAFIEEKLSVWLNHADNKGKRPPPPPPPGEF